MLMLLCVTSCPAKRSFGVTSNVTCNHYHSIIKHGLKSSTDHDHPEITRYIMLYRVMLVIGFAMRIELAGC